MKSIISVFFFGFLLNCLGIYATVTLNPIQDVYLFIADMNDSLILTLQRASDVRQIANIGMPFKTNFTEYASKDFVIYDYGFAEVKISIVVTDDRVNLNIRWRAPKDVRLQDCLFLGQENWYGGPEQKEQQWPIEKLKFAEYPYITQKDDNAVSEPYWLNSKGTFFYVHKEVPLFIDQRNLFPNFLCFIAEVKSPYSSDRSVNELSYDVVVMDNPKSAHMYAVEKYLGKPIALPDFRMIEHPVWSTWARYFRPINESILMTLANEIVSNKFNNSQFEIDDLWETCYGSLEVDTRKFPDFKKLVRDIKDMGFRVTLWIHPFINNGCEPWHTEAKNKGYFIKSENGSILTDWWNNNGTQGSYVDFTNPEAKSWWTKRLITLQNRYEIDSFKFDAGESTWTPQIPTQTGSVFLHPSLITEKYIRAVADFGPLVEVRSAQRTQDLPIYVRMLDLDSRWSFNNGLPTLVTTLLQMNMNGYPFVLPDMIGGNGYIEKPSKELFIRWLQANTFMPSLQFSFVPWDFDVETIAISHTFTNLHAKYANVIKAAMENSVKYGTPVNPPIWWIDPTDIEALGVWDEYLLGEDILVAPILEEGHTYRSVYLPKGLWLLGEDPKIQYTGGNWFWNISAPLNTLLYFKRIQ